MENNFDNLSPFAHSVRECTADLLDSADPERLQKFFDANQDNPDCPYTPESEARLIAQAENNLNEVKVFVDWAAGHCGGLDAAGCRSAYLQDRTDNTVAAILLVVPIGRLVQVVYRLTGVAILAYKATKYANLSLAELKAIIGPGTNRYFQELCGTALRDAEKCFS